MAPTPEILNEKCRECKKCSGLAKRAHTIEELEKIPGVCFVDALDLGEDDQNEIANPRKDSALIALIDSLVIPDLKAIDRTIAAIAGDHYYFNQRPWIKRTEELYLLNTGRPLPGGQFKEVYDLNFERYKLWYALSYPELTRVVRPARTLSWDKLCRFLEKADEVSIANVERYGIRMGTCDAFRIKLVEAAALGKKCIPSYTSEIIGFSTSPKKR